MPTVISTASQPPINKSVGPTSAGPPPKKKRKRTGTGGASDDCFACSTRGVQCDRKRPYCTQCIDIGKECSGYKTTLTWGVGVASRGKLRGLSCPIANKNADGSDVSPVEREERRRRKSSVSQSKKEDTAKMPSTTAMSSAKASTAAEGVAKNNSTAAQGYTQPSETLFTQQPPNQWPQQDFRQQLYTKRVNGVRDESAPLQPLQTSMNPPLDPFRAPKSGRPMSAYSDSAFYSPMDFPQTPASLQYSEPLRHTTSAPFQNQDLASAASDGTNHGPFLDPNQSPVNLHNGAELSQSSTPSGLPTVHGALGQYNDGLYSTGHLPLTPLSGPTLEFIPEEYTVDQEDAEDGTNELALIDTQLSGPFFHIPPRLQTLMEYYDRSICPYLVAFDSSENPYRRHVLQLAFQNESLQNAIAALAINNHRMRTKELRQNGYVGEIGDVYGNPSVQEPSGPTQEESLYKQLSINDLNLQLADPRAAQDDSVLATLLILCLFHVCDSGFSKFKTQLAGVQKLLSMRHPNTHSDFTRWVEMFFTWFDVMTSTVNDREVQIKGESLAMLDFNVNLGALEQFSGCDGRLFKLIARLGRLNLLAQGRPVRRQNGDRPAQQTLQRPSMWWRKRALRKPASLHPSDYENIDGNGWGTPIISSDEDAEGSADDEVPSATTTADDRTDFWAEWHDIRSRLQAWRMSSIPTTTNDMSQDFFNTTPEQRDMYHINEFFRYAALLYTERLGNPVLPSSHDQFQTLVSTALSHLSALQVTSCVNKFLLWPLFIIGTECVDEEHRSIIRTRCRDLSEESGFYNNMSSLFVLERVWREVGSNVRGHEAEEMEVRARRRDSEVGRKVAVGGRGGRYGQAFRWRKAMDRVDGEYIVL